MNGSARLLALSVVLTRVLVIVAAWLGLFLLVFFGYLTLPLFVLVLWLVVYGTYNVLARRRGASIQPLDSAGRSGSAAP